MKKYKKNEIKEHNYYYAGASDARKKHGQAKPGVSRQQKIQARFYRIRCDEKDFNPYGYIDIQNISKARLEALEHEVKAILVDMGFKQTGNDHFEFEMNPQFSPKENNMIFCALCLHLAKTYCKEHKLEYTLTWLC